MLDICFPLQSVTVLDRPVLRKLIAERKEILEPPQEELSGRSRVKREEILAAATGLFLDRGYAATTMDEIATEASVSKQTVYKNFGDKESLFREIAISTLSRVSEPFHEVIAQLATAEDVNGALREFGRRYIKMVISADLLSRRQVIVREAGRFPDLAREYYDGAPRRTQERLADAFSNLSERGKLTIDDPEMAATHFSFLLLGSSLDRVMFTGYQTEWSDEELTAMADAGVEVFLRAYGPPTEPGVSGDG